MVSVPTRQRANHAHTRKARLRFRTRVRTRVRTACHERPIPAASFVTAAEF